MSTESSHIGLGVSFDHPIPMLLFCPRCGAQHIDAPQPEKNWDNPPHKSHECQSCSYVWRPADVPTTGVAEIETKGSRDQSAAPATLSFVGSNCAMRAHLKHIRETLEEWRDRPSDNPQGYAAMASEVEELIEWTKPIRSEGGDPQCPHMLEIQRLKSGRFTPEEFQNLCHETDKPCSAEEFAEGCRAYQKQLFGKAPAGPAEIVTINGLGGGWVEVDRKYDYANARNKCPICGSLGMPWAGWFNCEDQAHKSIVSDGRSFVRVNRFFIIDQKGGRVSWEDLEK